MKKRALIIISVAILTALSALLLFGCGSAKDSYPGGSDDSKNEGIVSGDVNRKIYYTVNLDLEANDPTAVGETVKARTKLDGGYVQQENANYYDGGESFYFVVRIPTGKLDGFLAAIEKEGKVGGKQISTTDITTQYVSAEARKEALESERTVLNGLMQKAETVADVLSISDRIAAINTELGALERELNSYDSLIDYSTVTVRINMPEKVSVAAIVVPIVLALAAAGIAIAVILTRKKKKSSAYIPNNSENAGGNP